MGARLTALWGDDDARTNALRQELMARGHTVVTAWPAERLLMRAMSSKAKVLLLDGYLAGGTLRSIAEEVTVRPGSGVIAVGPLQPNIEVLIALASGVGSYLRSNSSPESVVDAVEAFYDGQVILPLSVSLPLLAGLHDGLGLTVEGAGGVSMALTRREWEILVLARQAHTTAEMAERLVVSKATIRSHVASLMHKLDIPSREALAWPLNLEVLRKTNASSPSHDDGIGVG